MPAAASPRLALAIAAVALAVPTAARADDDLAGSVIFARGSSLYRVDTRGRGEAEIAQLASKVTVRALRCDAGGRVLLADLAGKWAWMPLDGSTRSLIDLPCADGPAQLTEDGSAVLCRAPRAANQSIIVELAGGASGKPAALDIPPGAARLTGERTERKLVWADATGVWTAPPGELRKKIRVAADPPLRGFLPGPDGERAIGVYPDQIYADLHHTRPAEVLMTVQLDGHGGRRKAIRDGVAVEWSHDAQWILVQDGGSTCIMRVTGGQYKCWRGYTAASLSSDGRWALALGNRDGSKKQAAAKPAKAGGKPSTAARTGKPSPDAARAAARAADDLASMADDKPWDHLDEPSDEPESGESGEAPPANDDVSVAPPSGPLSLYRLRLEGAFTDRPTLLVKVVDGAAVWVPAAP
jgi:hypothetical protein